MWSLILSLDSRGCLVQSHSSGELHYPCEDTVVWQSSGEEEEEEDEARRKLSDAVFWQNEFWF